MTPAAIDHLYRAREALDEAEQILTIKLAKVAARSAYFAAFHAAEALIAERTGKVAKTHSGVRTEFARLTRDVDRIHRPLLSFLAQAYRYKESSDYAIGAAGTLTQDEARHAIETADRFIVFVAAMLEIDLRPSALD